MPNSELPDETINQSYQELANQWGIGLSFLFSILLRVIVPIYWPKMPLLFLLTSTLCIILPILLFFRLKKEVIKTLLAGTLSYKQAVVLGSIIGIICAAIILFSHVLSNSVHAHSGIPAFQGRNAIELLKLSYSKSLRGYGIPRHFSLLLYYAPFYCLLVPLGEEIIFRGWLQTRFLKKMGPIKAALAVTFVFLLCHLSINFFMFVSSSMFALIRMKTRSLLCCSFAHAIANLSFIVVCAMVGCLS